MKRIPAIPKQQALVPLTQQIKSNIHNENKIQILISISWKKHDFEQPV